MFKSTLGGRHPPSDQGEQLGAGLERRADLGSLRQPGRPARHLPERPSRMDRKVSSSTSFQDQTKICKSLFYRSLLQIRYIFSFNIFKTLFKIPY